MHLAVSLYLIPQLRHLGFPAKFCHMMIELYKKLRQIANRNYRKNCYYYCMFKTPNMEADNFCYCQCIDIHSDYLHILIYIPEVLRAL